MPTPCGPSFLPTALVTDVWGMAHDQISGHSLTVAALAAPASSKDGSINHITPAFPCPILPMSTLTDNSLCSSVSWHWQFESHLAQPAGHFMPLALHATQLLLMSHEQPPLSMGRSHLADGSAVPQDRLLSQCNYRRTLSTSRELTEGS
eukprot:350499-Chlamydomonas_euryale.AAC.8